MTTIIHMSLCHFAVSLVCNDYYWNYCFKQMVKERQDITMLNCMKGASGKVIVDDKEIRDSWKEYMEKLMNEENEWDHKIPAEVKEGPADCIRMAEVRAVLKKMKRHKAPGLSGY